jgi:hypothetical protein
VTSLPQDDELWFCSPLTRDLQTVDAKISPILMDDADSSYASTGKAHVALRSIGREPSSRRLVVSRCAVSSLLPARPKRLVAGMQRQDLQFRLEICREVGPRMLTILPA